ncbi:MAG: putative Ig domain-containing protein [Bacteroidota bacterium]
MKNIYLIIAVLITACNGAPISSEMGIDYPGKENPGEIPIIFGEGIVSKKNRFEMGLTISPNGKSMAFGIAHESKAEETCIYLMNYINKGWTDPDKTFLPDNVNTFFPMFGPLGKELYFVKSVNGLETDLWVAKYENYKATSPIPLDTIFNSRSREAGHGKSNDGTFYFTSNRDDQHQCCGDIYYAGLGPNGYKNVQKVPNVNSTADEESLYVGPKGDYLIIQSWKNEYGTKHDLYISYKNKNGSWSVPERLNDHINSSEIEQRPFVSPENKFLFFSRMSVTQMNGEDMYESDIYWVSTASIFGPYLYNTMIKYEPTYNEPFKIDLPKDLFKDIDDVALTYKASLASGTELPEWIQFDPSNFSLTGKWNSREDVKIKIVATDSFGNEGVFTLTLNEKKI